MPRFSAILSALLIGALLPNLSFADWRLVSKNSSFTIGTTKNETVTEIHKFQELDGLVQNNGIASLTLNLLSVDTGIEIRDQRMQAMLFSASAQAVYRAILDVRTFVKMKAGESKEFQLEGILELNGNFTLMPVDTKVTRLPSGHYRIETVSANNIDVGLFGFSDGVEQLRAIANLLVISPIVTFEFDLEFEPLESD